MAIHLPSFLANISVISRKDDALPADLTTQEWENYLATLEESHLRLGAKLPTYFVMKIHLPYASQQMIQSKQLGVSDSGEPEVRLGFILDTVRCSLIDIGNPADLPTEQHIVFKKDRDGNASKELIALLHEAGIVMELFSARQNALERNSAAPIKK